MGTEFVQIIQQIYKEKNNGQTRGFGVIKANPDKSKHLETATINMEDQWIDFVNLRKEEYATDSRVPTIIFGTPLEDAQRRDLTINALFYNVNDDKIEDLTQKGLEDIKNGLIRTPLDPLQTFLDDPLRVLRVFRFAARYGFTLDTVIMPAVHNTQVLDALQHKISKERIGKELEPALEHPNSVQFLNYIYDAGLLPIVFEVVDKTLDPIKIEDISKRFEYNYLIWNKIMQTISKYEYLLLPANKQSLSQTRIILMLSALLYSFEQLRYNKSTLFCEQFIKNSLKLNNKTSDNVKAVLMGARSIQEFLSKNSNLEGWATVEFVALIIRELCTLYPLSLILLGSLPEPPKNLDKLLDVIKKHRLEHFFETKPILNGNDVMKEFGLQGKDIKELLDVAIRWQVRNPQGTREDVIKWLKEEHLRKRDKPEEMQVD